MLLKELCLQKRSMASLWSVIYRLSRNIHQNAAVKDTKTQSKLFTKDNLRVHSSSIPRTFVISADTPRRSITTSVVLTSNKQEVCDNGDCASHQSDNSSGKGDLVSTDKQEKAVGRPKPEFKCFYYFPPVNIIRLIQRFQLLVYATLLPSCIYHIYTIPSPSVLMTGFVAANVLFMPAVLYVMPRTIGSLSAGGVGEVVDTLKVSRLSFFGNRKDSYYKIEHVKPLSEVRHANLVYAKFELYNKKDKLYLFNSWAKILDKEMYEIIMGRLKE
ncbi:uncharacterized protein LOC133187889 [Saccostrea echinata]|uniref:uncharacterized protein LOC133187889 n=1 Tax=Saccostrea echinata TaxID=191078 RepID=UPI002A825FDC|nr:uncharacterized protein LOC133187889 [Saccostrea echinata]